MNEVGKNKEGSLNVTIPPLQITLSSFSLRININEQAFNFSDHI